MTQTDPGNVSDGNTIRVGLVTCAIVLSMMFLFLIPALYNGFPLVTSDTEGYLSGLHTPFRSDTTIYLTGYLIGEYRLGQASFCSL